jgi:hypothetical protein
MYNGLIHSYFTSTCLDAINEGKVFTANEAHILSDKAKNEIELQILWEYIFPRIISDIQRGYTSTTIFTIDLPYRYPQTIQIDNVDNITPLNKYSFEIKLLQNLGYHVEYIDDRNNRYKALKISW